MNLDATLSAYPCTPCNYAVSDLDDLDPAAEETLGAALKERLAYGAAVVVFDCGSGSSVEYEMLFTLPDLDLAGFHVGAVGSLGLPLRPLNSFEATCDGGLGLVVDGLPLSAECATDASDMIDQSTDSTVGPSQACGPVALAISMQFLNACNGGDFALARCAFSPAVAQAVDTATLGSLYASHTCEQPSGFRVERSNDVVRLSEQSQTDTIIHLGVLWCSFHSMSCITKTEKQCSVIYFCQDVVIIQCNDLQAGLIQWNVAVSPGQIAGLHFGAYGGDFDTIPAQCFPGGSLPQACAGSGH